MRVSVFFKNKVQVEIVQHFNDYHDLENALVVFRNLPKRVEDRLQDMKKTQTSMKVFRKNILIWVVVVCHNNNGCFAFQVFDTLLTGGYLNPDDALNCRSVCKAWRGAVDEHYKTANIYSSTFNCGKGYRYPRAAILVPMDGRASRKLIRYASHGACPFVGRRLMIKIGLSRGRILDQMEAQAVVTREGVQHVWDHVEHLEILQKDDLDGRDDDWYTGHDGLTDVLRPILEMLKNVKTVVFESKSLGAEVLRFMPGLSTLEQFVVLVDWDDDITDYHPILDICSGSLKLLRSQGYLAFCMDKIVQRNQFPRMNELWLAGPAPRLLNHRAEAINSLSNLRKIGLEFQYEREFYTLLVDVTFAFTRLEEVEINCVRDPYGREMPIMSLEHLGRAREGIKKLSIVESSKFAKEEFDVIVENCRSLFPSVDQLRIVSYKNARTARRDACIVT